MYENQQKLQKKQNTAIRKLALEVTSAQILRLSVSLGFVQSVGKTFIQLKEPE